MVKRFTAITVFVAVSVYAPAADAPDPLQLQVRPRVSADPGTFRITVLVEPHENNRRLTLVADSHGHQRSSTTWLPGAEAPRAHQTLLTSLPAGLYTIAAYLEHNDGSDFEERLEATVLGMQERR